MTTVTANLANRLVAVWAGVLARTRYLNQITTAPDGSRLVQVKGDGTTYDFWHDGRSGTTHSPDEGSLLDLVDVVETVTHYSDAPQAAQPALLRKLDTQLTRFQKRIGHYEPCLRPRAPRVGAD